MRKEVILDRFELHLQRRIRTRFIVKMISIFFSAAAILLGILFGKTESGQFILISQATIFCSLMICFCLARKGREAAASHLLFFTAIISIFSSILFLEGLNDGRENVGHFYFLPMGMGMIFLLWNSIPTVKYAYVWFSLGCFLFVQISPLHIPAMNPLHPESYRMGFVIVNLLAVTALGLLTTVFMMQSVHLEDSLRTTNEAIYALVNNMLPKEIAEELIRAGRIENRVHEKCTVMMVDIVKFTKFADQRSIGDLQNLIESFSMAVDSLIEESGAEKIKMIGDAYLIASGVPEADPYHADTILRLAINIVAATQKIDGLAVRIGIATGPVFAGIVGKTKLAFDIWGGTVNFASRLEQNALPQSILVSQRTYESTHSSFSFEKMQFFSTKDQKSMECYVLKNGQNGHLAS